MRVSWDDNEGSVRTPGYIAQDFHHFMPSLMIETACWFVADDQFRMMYQCARNRHALLLATAELGGQ
jgi:hypothetical protein